MIPVITRVTIKRSRTSVLQLGGRNFQKFLPTPPRQTHVSHFSIFHPRSRTPLSRVQRRRKTSIANESMISNTTKTAATENAGTYTRFQETIRQLLHKPRALPIPRWISPQFNTTTLAEAFGHSSFILVAASYAVDDFISLRLIAIAGSSAMLVFTYFHPHGRVLWLPFKWNFLFILINGYFVFKNQVDKFLADQLSDLMIFMYEHHFYVMDK